MANTTFKDFLKTPEGIALAKNHYRFETMDNESKKEANSVKIFEFVLKGEKNPIKVFHTEIFDGRCRLQIIDTAPRQIGTSESSRQDQICRELGLPSY